MKRLVAILMVLMVLVTCFAFGCGEFETPSNPEDAPSTTEYCYVTFKQLGYADIVKEVEKGKGLTDVPTPRSRKGYVVTWDVNNFSFIYADLEVIAQFTPKSYTVYYDDSLCDESLTPSTVTYDREYTLVVPERSGYHFIGWQYNGADISNHGIWNYDVTNIVLYPLWQESTSQNGEEYHAVTFIQESSEGVVGGKRTVLVKHGEAIDEADIPTPAQVKGYMVTWDHSIDDLQNVTEDIIVSTVNTPKNYKITYELQGGVMDEELPNEQQVTYGSAVRTYTASKSGYVFRGWAYQGQVLNSFIYLYDYSITVFAVWETEI